MKTFCLVDSEGTVLNSCTADDNINVAPLFLIDLARVLNAKPKDISEDDELRFERELREMSFVGKVFVIPAVEVKDVKPNRYYRLYKKSEPHQSIVYSYANPDLKDQNGFGFNIADGGGFIPFWDISDDTVLS